MCCGQREALPCKRLIFVKSASALRRAEQAECAADSESLAVQAIDFRAVSVVARQAERAECAADSKSLAVQALGFRAAASALRQAERAGCAADNERPWRTTGWCSCRPLRFYGGRNELNVLQTAISLPYKRLIFMQSASVAR